MNRAIQEPHDDPAYQAMVEELAKVCRCEGTDKPCDGLLSCGLCDQIDWRERREEDEKDQD